MHNHRLPTGNKQFSCSRALCACEVGTVCPTGGEYHPGTPGARVRVVCRGCGAVRSHFEGKRWVHNHRLPTGNKQFSCNRALCACEVGTVCPNQGAYHVPTYILAGASSTEGTRPLPYAHLAPAASAHLAPAVCSAASTVASAFAAAPLAPAPRTPAHFASAAPVPTVPSFSSEMAAAPSAVHVAATTTATPALPEGCASLAHAAAAPSPSPDVLAITYATPELAAAASADSLHDATPAAAATSPDISCLPCGRPA